MATSGITSMLNSRLRLSGLSSGLDTDTMVKQLMSLEQAKVDKVKQSRMLLEWKRDDYRSMINSIRSFKDEYFDVLKPATNMRSTSSFMAYKTTYSGAATSSYFTATAGAGAIAGSFSISSVQLATAAKATSSGAVTGAVAGAAVDAGTVISAANDNNKISVTFNGTTKEITMTDGISGSAAIAADLNSKLASAFGAGKITVDGDGGNITFNTASTNVLSIGSTYNGGYTSIFGKTISSPVTLDSLNNKFTVTLNGAAPVTIELAEGTYADADALMSEVQAKINNDPGLNGKVRVLNQSDRLVLKAIGSTGSASGALANQNVTSGVTIDSSNKTFDVTIDGVTKSITLEEKAYSKNELLTAVQAQLNTAFGSNKAMVSVDEATGKLRFEGISSTATLSAGREESGGLAALGFETANKSNKLDLTAKLSAAAGFFGISPLTASDGDNDGYDVEFTVNGKEFRFKSSVNSIGDVINAVNGDSEAGVTMTYDQLNDKFVVTSKTMGVTAGVKIEDVAGNGNLMASMGLSGVNANGTDASITYNDGTGDQTITRASNDFTINGIEISLKKEYSGSVGDPIDVKIEGDPTKVLDLVKGFINKYNELIDKINSELSEKTYKDFAPLTDEQKQAMTEKDIEQWEEKAKSGMLKNDSIISSFASKMRETLYKEVEGISTKLYSIGISTGSWDQKGKLVINEDKLKAAIAESPENVVSLFTKESTIKYSPDMSAADRATRDSENGIANRMYDVMQDFIRTTRNSDGQKGMLLERAGIAGDITENTSTLSKEISNKDTLIATLLDKLVDKENQYYAKFTAMETALSRMNSQMSWLTQQMSG